MLDWFTGEHISNGVLKIMNLGNWARFADIDVPVINPPVIGESARSIENRRFGSSIHSRASSKTMIRIPQRRSGKAILRDVIADGSVWFGTIRIHQPKIDALGLELSCNAL